jgi:transposase-like protein
MSKKALREETERLIKEAIEKKALTVSQGKTRIDATCGKCGAPNRVNAPMGERRVPFTCKECGHRQRTF